MATKTVSRRMLARIAVEELQTASAAERARLGKSLAAYLIVNKMTNQLDMLLGDIAVELARNKRHLYATIISARVLDAAIKQEMTHFLKKTFAIASVELDESVDPALIGGAVITTPEMQLDTSVRSKLRRLRQV